MKRNRNITKEWEELRHPIQGSSLKRNAQGGHIRFQGDEAYTVFRF